MCVARCKKSTGSLCVWANTTDFRCACGASLAGARGFSDRRPFGGLRWRVASLLGTADAVVILKTKRRRQGAVRSALIGRERSGTARYAVSANTVRIKTLGASPKTLRAPRWAFCPSRREGIADALTRGAAPTVWRRKPREQPNVRPLRTPIFTPPLPQWR
jgi:hypothetical protein